MAVQGGLSSLLCSLNFFESIEPYAWPDMRCLSPSPHGSVEADNQIPDVWRPRAGIRASGSLPGGKGPLYAPVCLTPAPRSCKMQHVQVYGIVFIIYRYRLIYVVTVYVYAID